MENPKSLLAFISSLLKNIALRAIVKNREEREPDADF